MDVIKERARLLKRMNELLAEKSRIDTEYMRAQRDYRQLEVVERNQRLNPPSGVTK